MKAQTISKCYLKFEGVGGYLIDSVQRMPFGVRSYEYFKVEKNKEISVYIYDRYTLNYIDSAKEVFFIITIKQSQTKKYKEYLLQQLNAIGEHHKTDHGEEGLIEINLPDCKIYGFNSVNISNTFLGKYVLFPNEKMAIYIDFINNNTKNRFISLGDFKKMRNIILSSYVSFFINCKNN